VPVKLGLANAGEFNVIEPFEYAGSTMLVFVPVTVSPHVPQLELAPPSRVLAYALAIVVF
jgi:hypothetical protein